MALQMDIRPAGQTGGGGVYNNILTFLRKAWE